MKTNLTLKTGAFYFLSTANLTRNVPVLVDLETLSQAELDSIKASVDSMKTTIGNKLDTVNSTINKANTDIVAAINAMKASNDTKNDAIIAALQRLVTQVNRNTSNINSLNNRVDALEQA